MLTQRVIRRLIAVAIVIAVPSFGCFGWYTLGPDSHASDPLQFIVAAAYPVALISLGLLVLALTSATRPRWQVQTTAAVLMVAVSVILLARSGHLLG